MRTCLIVVGIFLTSCAAMRLQAATPDTAMQGARWIKTFDDEFSGKALNTQSWTVDTGHQANREKPLGYHWPEMVTVSGGALHIRSVHEHFDDRDYISGQITTHHKFTQLYGLYEVRCRFPSGKGVWPAVFLLPADGNWPPEIDIAEFIGRQPHSVYLTNHWGSDLKHHHQSNSNYKNKKIDWTEWHIYAARWEPGKVTWYIDHKLVGVTPAKAVVSSQSMYLVANLDVGGSFAGKPDASQWPRTFDIDYIRVYQRARQ